MNISGRSFFVDVLKNLEMFLNNVSMRKFVVERNVYLLQSFSMDAIFFFTRSVKITCPGRLVCLPDTNSNQYSIDIKPIRSNWFFQVNSFISVPVLVSIVKRKAQEVTQL